MALRFETRKVKTFDTGKEIKDFFYNEIVGPKYKNKAPNAASSAGKRGGKPMAGAPKAGATRRGGKQMAESKAVPAAKPAAAKAAPMNAKPAVTAPKKKAAPKAAAKAAPKAAPKASSYGNESYAQHEAFRKELEAGGGRAAWSMDKQVSAGGATVEISKPASSTSLNAELEKFQASGGKAAKKDVKLGVIGRTGGKWHLGKKAGKG